MTRRISDTELERIKGSLDLVAEVRKRGIELKLKGQELVGLCTFHDEKTPSFSVNEAKQVWKCFGCGKGGDALQFIMEYEKEGFLDALARIEGSPTVKTVNKRNAAQPDIEKNTRTPQCSQKIISDVLEYYHQTLKNTVKDPKSGEFKVQNKCAKGGPCAILLTTTSLLTLFIKEHL